MSPLEPPVVLRLDDVKGRSLPGWSGGSGAGGSLLVISTKQLLIYRERRGPRPQSGVGWDG